MVIDFWTSFRIVAIMGIQHLGHGTRNDFHFSSHSRAADARLTVISPRIKLKNPTELTLHRRSHVGGCHGESEPTCSPASRTLLMDAKAVTLL